jgi:hypothetical protein
MSFEKDMEQYEDDWAGDMEKQSQAQVLGEGTYQAKVAESRVSQTGGDDGWEFILRFEDLNGKGAVTCWDSLETEVGRSIAASHAKALGYDGKLGGLKEYCEGGNFDDLVAEIRVKDRHVEEKTYKSVYINRLFGKLDPGEEHAMSAAGGGSGMSDDDIPFAPTVF